MGGWLQWKGILYIPNSKSIIEVRLCSFTGSHAILSGPSGGVVSQIWSMFCVLRTCIPVSTLLHCNHCKFIGWLCSNYLSSRLFSQCTCHWIWYGWHVYWCLTLCWRVWACFWEYDRRCHHTSTTGTLLSIPLFSSYAYCCMHLHIDVSCVTCM